MPASVLDEVLERPLERGTVAAHGHRRRRDVDVGRRGRPSQLVECHVRARRGVGFFPREGEQVVGEARKTLGVRFEIGDELRRRAVAREVRDIPAQRSQRRAQLVRGVGEEPALRLARTVEAVEHRVQRRCKRTDLVGSVRVGQAALRVSRALDLAGGTCEPGERAERAAHQEGDGQRTDRSGAERREHRRGVQCIDRVGDVRRRGRDERGAARGGTGDVRERRRVDAKLVAAEPNGAVAARCACDRLPRERARQDASAERERPRDDAPATVDDLHHRLGGADRRVERPRRRQERRGGRRQLRNRDGA